MSGLGKEEDLETRLIAADDSSEEEVPISAVSNSPISVRSKAKLQPASESLISDGDSSTVVSVRAAEGKKRALSPTRQPFVPQKKDYLYTKMKYYSSLRRVANQSPNSTFDPHYLAPPPSIIPRYLFGLSDSPNAKQTRWQTITSVINTMMGTSIVSLPFGMAHAGMGMGILITCLTGAIACFTCLLVVKHGKAFDEFTEFVRHYMGAPWQYAAGILSAMVMLGACIVYHILMQESLYDLVLTIATSSGHSIHWWSRILAATVIFLIVFPISNLKTMSALVKVNSIGFLFLWYTIIFIVYHGVHAIIEGNVHSVLEAPDTASVAADAAVAIGGSFPVVWGVESKFGSLGGIMMLSFFIHNCIQTITKQSPAHTVNVDVVLAYLITGIFYLIVGVLGYIGFADGDIHVLQSNFLNMFGSTFESGSQVYAFTARFSLLFQLISVYPVLQFIVRSTVYGTMYKTQYPGFWKVLLLHTILVGITFAFAAADLQVGDVVRYTGAIGGIVLIFIIPITIDIIIRRKEGRMTMFWWILHGGMMLWGTTFFVLQFVPL